ncbi:rod-binding protein [Sphingomonas sp. 37zxx]|uniref:rod-binding protein n=1 Tax=Sphingomonas sp. 37zxx TaxID=1550073 RepID=UPI00053BE5B2|nr:rod-binding protein [Sphingomonas sp. 37zxx]
MGQIATVAAPAQPAASPQAPSSPAVTKAVRDAAAARDTAQQFEAVFLGQITKMMLESVESDDQFSGGAGEEMFRGVLAEHMGTAIASVGGVGLAPSVLAQIIKMQEDAGNGE